MRMAMPSTSRVDTHLFRPGGSVWYAMMSLLGSTPHSPSAPSPTWPSVRQWPNSWDTRSKRLKKSMSSGSGSIAPLIAKQMLPPAPPQSSV